MNLRRAEEAWPARHHWIRRKGQIRHVHCVGLVPHRLDAISLQHIRRDQRHRLVLLGERFLPRGDVVVRQLLRVTRRAHHAAPLPLAVDEVAVGVDSDDRQPVEHRIVWPVDLFHAGTDGRHHLMRVELAALDLGNALLSKLHRHLWRDLCGIQRTSIRQQHQRFLDRNLAPVLDHAHVLLSEPVIQPPLVRGLETDAIGLRILGLVRLAAHLDFDEAPHGVPAVGRLRVRVDPHRVERVNNGLNDQVLIPRILRAVGGLDAPCTEA